MVSKLETFAAENSPASLQPSPDLSYLPYLIEVIALVVLALVEALRVGPDSRARCDNRESSSTI